MVATRAARPLAAADGLRVACAMQTTTTMRRALEPILAIAFLAGIAMFLATATAGKLFDDRSTTGCSSASRRSSPARSSRSRTTGSAARALLLGLRCLGSMSRYRRARYVVGLSTAPFVLALVVVWPLRIAIFGADLFRSGGSDEGVTAHELTVVDGAFALWALALIVVGVRTVESWSWVRSIGATAFAAALFALLVLAAVLALARRDASPRRRELLLRHRVRVLLLREAPLRTSAAYASSASRSRVARCAYRLTNRGTVPAVEAEQVVPDEHLAVAVGAGADPDRRDRERGRDPRRDGRRHALEHEREAAGRLERERVARRAAAPSRPSAPAP